MQSMLVGKFLNKRHEKVFTYTTGQNLNRKNYYGGRQLDNKKNVIDAFESGKEFGDIFEDFLTIHCNFIQTILVNDLAKYMTDKDAKYFFSQMRLNRNICALLPFQTNILAFSCLSEDYCKLISYFDKIGNKNMKLFCMIYNGVSNMLLKKNTTKLLELNFCFGFDAWLYEKVIEPQKNQNDSNDSNNSNSTSTIEETKTNKEKKTLVELLKDYILDQIAQSGICGEFISKYGTKTSDKETEMKKKMEAISKCEKLFYNDDFEKMLEWCVEDFKYKNDLSRLLSIYSKNTVNKNAKVPNSDYGITFFVINRLSYFLFNRLINSW